VQIADRKEFIDAGFKMTKRGKNSGYSLDTSESFFSCNIYRFSIKLSTKKTDSISNFSAINHSFTFPIFSRAICENFFEKKGKCRTTLFLDDPKSWKQKPQ
jgi:hypothetical protein